MTNIDLQRLSDANIYDQENDKIGSVGGIYFDDKSDNPTFVTVKTGLFGTKETFLPIDKVEETKDGFKVPFTKDFVKDAPNVDADGHITPAEEREIYEYYKRDYTSAGAAGVAGQAGTAGAAGKAGVADGAKVEGGETAVAHEERLKVGTETHDAEQVRLRKHVVEDTETVEVPVQREELVVERESIDPNSAEARGGAIGDEKDETITLREERPVVDKETVATEKVNIGKQTVEDTQTVSGDVRREEIDVERDNKNNKR